jgi:hypothetical protein
MLPWIFAQTRPLAAPDGIIQYCRGFLDADKLVLGDQHDYSNKVSAEIPCVMECPTLSSPLITETNLSTSPNQVFTAVNNTLNK